jgi:hypothetical protein
LIRRIFAFDVPADTTPGGRAGKRLGGPTGEDAGSAPVLNVRSGRTAVWLGQAGLAVLAGGEVTIQVSPSMTTPRDRPDATLASHRRRRRLSVLAVLSLACLGRSELVLAQDLEPRAYSNAPAGLNFIVAGYASTDGGVSVDPTVPLTNAQIRTDSAIVAYARTLDAWGRSAKFDVIAAATSLSGRAEVAGELREREVSGLTDTRVRYTLNLIGAPAMSAREFVRYRQDLNIGASLQVGVPTGQYDASRLVNIGTHRWSFKGELGISKALGPWTLELMPAVTFYTDNDDFAGGQTRSQEPVYSVQVHAVYVFRPGWWLALDGTYFAGGRTTTDGVASVTEFDNTRIGATFAMPIDRRHSIKLYASTGTATRTGSDFTAIGAAWQYRWGADL